MKKSTLLLFAVVLGTVSLFAQSKGTTAVVMYFKADLACCKARACAALETDIQTIVEKNFPDGNVVFKEVKISDPENASLVEQYKAQSQTVIVVVRKKKKFHSADATELVKAYVQNQDKEAFETAFVAFIQKEMK